MLPPCETLGRGSTPRFMSVSEARSVFASNLCADIRSLPRSKIGSPIIDPTDIRVALTPRTIDIPIVFATGIPYMGLYRQWELEVRKVFHHPLSTGSLLT